MLSPKTASGPRWISRTLVTVLLVAVLALAPLSAPWSVQAAAAAPAASCSSGNFSGIYQTEDVSLSGDLYVTGHVTIRNGITLTLEAGTHVIFCGAYQISTATGGSLAAIGTAAEPVTFAADNPASPWTRILLEGQTNHSILQHVIISDGGGDDADANIGSVHIDVGITPLPSPILDHVTINDSGAYGLYVKVNADDTTPPSITHVAINNSASGAVLATAQALGGFGSGNTYSGNTPNTIQVIHGGASRLYHSQIWQPQAVPYELLGQATVAAASAGDPFPTLTIQPGATFLMDPDAELRIGTSLGRGASLLAEGTEAEPITFTHYDSASGPWNQLYIEHYPGTQMRLAYVDLSYGGSGGVAMLQQSGSGSLRLDHVTVRQSKSAGLRGQGSVSIHDSLFEFNLTGMEFYQTAQVVIRNSVIANNLDVGVRSLDSGGNYLQHCIDAAGNYWGSPDGPDDSFNQADGCGQASTNAGSGDSVTGAVLYAPWLPGEDPLQDRSRIQPDPFYVIADGVDAAQVVITLRDAQGNPLAGKQVQLNTTLGTVDQPAQPTDASGMTTAAIKSSAAGFAYLSAQNLTDGMPLAGTGGVRFWQGAGDGSGLIDPSGAPFAAPELMITGAPFQVGFPVGLSMPMQNSNAFPVDVTVVYGVSHLGVGVPFAPVYTTTATLQPGESWDAQGVWLPLTTGHHCIQALVTSDAASALAAPQFGGLLTRQKNTESE